MKHLLYLLLFTLPIVATAQIPNPNGDFASDVRWCQCKLPYRSFTPSLCLSSKTILIPQDEKI
jgi:hypothetical protein